MMYATYSQMLGVCVWYTERTYIHIQTFVYVYMQESKWEPNDKILTGESG